LAHGKHYHHLKNNVAFGPVKRRAEDRKGGKDKSISTGTFPPRLAKKPAKELPIKKSIAAFVGVPFQGGGG